MQMGLNHFQVIHICFETLEASEAAPHPVSCLDRTWIVPISGYALNSTTSDCSENSQAVLERKQPLKARESTLVLSCFVSRSVWWDLPSEK